MKILQIMCHPDYNGEHRVSENDKIRMYSFDKIKMYK